MLNMLLIVWIFCKTLRLIYFGDYEKTVELLSNASVKQELYIATNENEESLGFIYYMSKGVFGSYPYLHIIAVKKEYRSLGNVRQFKLFEVQLYGDQ